jgi:virulence-associated protein VapD
MFAIAFDLVVGDTAKHHPKGVSQAYTDIGLTLNEFGFDRVQGSLYVSDNEDLANLFLAIQALRDKAWFPKSVRDLRAFRVDQWSDFTAVVRSSYSKTKSLVIECRTAYPVTLTRKSPPVISFGKPRFSKLISVGEISRRLPSGLSVNWFASSPT